MKEDVIFNSILFCERVFGKRDVVMVGFDLFFNNIVVLVVGGLIGCCCSVCCEV